MHALPAAFGHALRGLPSIAGHERLLPIGVGVIVIGAAIISTAPVETARGVAPTAVAPRLTIAGLAGGIDDRELHYDTTGPMSTEIDDSSTGDVGDAIPTEGPIIWKPVVVDTTVPDSRDLLRRYRVQAGDTLTGIARKFDVTMMTVWWANHLKSKNDLHVGQTLVIPPTSGLVVTVREGDTLDEIATRSKVGKDAIFEYNGLEDEVLVAGQVLMIPGALGQAIAVPKPKPQPRTTVSTRSGGTVRRVTSSPPRHYGGGAFAWPLPGGRIVQYYHYGHYGIDIDGDTGDPVVSAAAGTVIFAGWKSNGGGYQVWIAHGSNLYTTYNHMSSVAVHTGSHVARGQRVGRVGCTGNCTGPHLHFEVWNGPVWDGGTRVNPLKYL